MLGAYYPGYGYPGMSGIPSSGKLTVQGQSITVSLGAVSLSQKHMLAVSDLAVDTSIPNSPLNVLLYPQDVDVSITIGNVTLSQKHTLVVDSQSIAVALDNATLSQKHTLDSNDLEVSTTIGAPALIQFSYVYANDSQVTVTLEGVTLTQKHTLDINDLSVAVSIDNVETIKFKPPIDPLAGIQDVVIDIPMIDKPVLQIGLSVDQEQLMATIQNDRRDGYTEKPVIGIAGAKPLVVSGSSSGNEDRNATIRPDALSVDTLSTPSTDISHGANTALMEDTSVLMEDPNTLMGNQFSRGERPRMAGVTVDGRSISVDNDKQKESLANVSR